MHDNLPVTLLARMALVALVIGTSVTVAATERLTLSLVLSGSLGWVFVPLLQLLTGLLLVRGLPGGRMRQLERYFATHWPWSIWILVFNAAVLLLPMRLTGLWLTATAVVPMLWTVWLLMEFCRQDLALDSRMARRRVLLHQSVTYVLVVGYVSVAVALWPRLAGIIG